MQGCGQVWQIGHRMGSDREQSTKCKCLSAAFLLSDWEFVQSNTDTLRSKKSRTGLEICSSPWQTRQETQHSSFLVSISIQASFKQKSNWNYKILVLQSGGFADVRDVEVSMHREGGVAGTSSAVLHEVHLLQNLSTTWTKAREMRTPGRFTSSSWSELKH